MHPGRLNLCRRRQRFQNPAEHGKSLAERAAETLTALSQMLGPYPFSSLSLTENPSAESQGWPGLIFLSSYAYLQPEQLRAMNLPAGRRRHLQRSDDAPRVGAPVVSATRSRGRAITSSGCWRGLANYCSLLLLERSRPADVQITLETYRRILASRSPKGRQLVEAGPVTLGSRLSSSHFPNGYEIITYGRGTWLIHMLRWMLRDASRTEANPNGDDTVFLALLRNLAAAVQGQANHQCRLRSRRSRRCCRDRCGSKTASRWIGSSMAG